MRRRRSSGDLPSPDGGLGETLPPITEQNDESVVDDNGSIHKRFSVDSKCSSPEDDCAKPPSFNKLKKSDSRTSFSGMISKMIKQNRTAKLWKEEAIATKSNFNKKKAKLTKTRSLPIDQKALMESRSISADQGYESSDAICGGCSRESGEDDDTSSQCSACYAPELRTFRRSVSSPGMSSHSLASCRQKMASRHWQWFLRSASSTWQSFNTHKTYCY